MIQLIRTVPGVPDAVRQLRVGGALLDQSWPEVGLFIELDGQQHAGQPVYDARRETAVVAATVWFCGRFTWHEVVRVPTSTGRRLAAAYQQALLRPLVVRFLRP
jgi:very-short-patch-repair endonuclease